MPRGLQRQSGLAHASRASQGHEAVRRDEIHDGAERRLAPDQLGQVEGEIRQAGRRSDGCLIVADLTRELIAAPGHRPDEMAIGAQNLSEHGDLGSQVVFLDDPVRPHAAHELVLADDRAASVDEGNQRIERPTAQLDRSAIGQQLAAMAHDLEPAKFNSYRNATLQRSKARSLLAAMRSAVPNPSVKRR